MASLQFVNTASPTFRQDMGLGGSGATPMSSTSIGGGLTNSSNVGAPMGGSVGGSSGVSESQGTSQGSSQGTSGSSSYPVVPQQDPQIGFLEQFGNVAGELGSQQYDWAHNQFDDNSELTDQNINGYLSNADMANTAAQRDYQNYNDIFNPAAGSLTQDWQSYTSPERVNSEMGASEANVAQNFEGQRKNIEQNLRSYGVNPSDPRYAGMMAANRTAQAASEAGAGTQARLNTEATGRGLRTQALGEAHLLPGQQATEQNVAYQGHTGAENAALSNTSMGALTLGTTPGYLNSGIADVKFSPVGQVSNSTSQNTAQNSSQNSSHGANQSSNASQAFPPASGGGSGGGGGSKPSSGFRQAPSPQQQPGGSRAGSGSGTQPNGADGANYSNPYGSGPGIQNVPDGGYNSDPFGSYDPNSSGINPDGSYAGQNAGSWNGDWGTNPMDSGAGGSGDPNQNGYTDPGAAPEWDPHYDSTPQIGSWDNGVNALEGSGWSGESLNDANADYTGGFAQGGAIPEGGMIPHSMSPSGGTQTDDVPAVIPQTGGKAQLNAGEFVIPQDVVQWHGHKFFQDLIEKSRKGRQHNPGPAHPTHPGGVPHHAGGGLIAPGSPEWDAAFQATQQSNQARAQNIFHGTSWDVNDPAQVQRAGATAAWMRRYKSMNPNATPDQLQQVQQHFASQGASQAQSVGGWTPDGGIPDQQSRVSTSPPRMDDGVSTGGGGGQPGGGRPLRPNQASTGGSRPVPTMRAYQQGNRDQGFHPQASYTNPRSRSNGTNPGWTPVHRPTAAVTPAAPTPAPEAPMAAPVPTPDAAPAPDTSSQQPAGGITMPNPGQTAAPSAPPGGMTWGGLGGGWMNGGGGGNGSMVFKKGGPVPRQGIPG